MPARSKVAALPPEVKAWLDGALAENNFSDYELLADELKARGYDNAGIYNPQGVGGTHVMYVLHHNDQPELYHNLPKDPAIDTSINLWKGALKPLSAAGFIATFAGLIYHYIGIGPNKEVDDDEEEHHE